MWRHAPWVTPPLLLTLGRHLPRPRRGGDRRRLGRRRRASAARAPWGVVSANVPHQSGALRCLGPSIGPNPCVKASSCAKRERELAERKRGEEPDPPSSSVGEKRKKELRHRARVPCRRAAMRARPMSTHTHTTHTPLTHAHWGLALSMPWGSCRLDVETRGRPPLAPPPRVCGGEVYLIHTLPYLTLP